jgi:RNA polymerase sigma factor (sigma-70 family)
MPMVPTTAVPRFRQVVDRAPAIVQTDDSLVARVRAGDAAAFEEIYDRYARGMLGFCVHMLGSREAAEDALQLTFVSAYRALRAGESDIALRPWLYTIARNRCLSELRTRHDDAAELDQMAEDRPLFEGPTDQVQRREELSEMLEDMQRLPADQRAALVLFELGDHSHKEIATILGVRAEKVKALIFQAREALVRGRQARNHPCEEIRERLATSRGRVPRRSMIRAHIDRCPSCALFEHEVRHQRAALALILPVALTGELKAWILSPALHGGVAAGVGACGGGGGVVAAGAGAGACGSGAVAAGGATVAGGASVAGGVGASAAVATGGIAGAGTSAAGAAVVAAAPVAAAATGLTAVGEYAASVGVGGLGATGVVAKILTVAAIATGAAGAAHVRGQTIRPIRAPATVGQILTTPATPAPASVTTPDDGDIDAPTTPVATAGPPSAGAAGSGTSATSATSATSSPAALGSASASATSTASASPGASTGSAAGGTSTTPVTTTSPSDGATSADPTSSTAGSTTSAAPGDPGSSSGGTTSTAPTDPGSSSGSTTSTAATDPASSAGDTSSAAPADLGTSATITTAADPTSSTATTGAVAPADPASAGSSSISTSETTSVNSAPAAAAALPDPTSAPPPVDGPPSTTSTGS